MEFIYAVARSLNAFVYNLDRRAILYDYVIPLSVITYRRYET